MIALPARPVVSGEEAAVGENRLPIRMARDSKKGKRLCLESVELLTDDNPKGVSNLDAWHRMHYLLKLAQAMVIRHHEERLKENDTITTSVADQSGATASEQQSPEAAAKSPAIDGKSRRRDGKEGGKESTCLHLARFYIKTMKEIASGLVLRLHTTVKRFICRQCNVPWIPSVSCRVRLRSRQGASRMVYTCLECGFIRRYPLLDRDPACLLSLPCP